MNDRTNQIIGGVIVVILIIGAWYVGRSQLVPGAIKNSESADSVVADTSDPASNAVDGNSAASTPSVTASGESVVVGDQPAGSMVRVTSVTLSQLGWVAVRDNNGRVLGAGRFDAGTHANVDVELIRNTVAGEKYQVLLYVDDGDKLYDLHKDSLVMNADASVAGATFSATNGD